MATPNQALKACAKCKIVKSVTEFYTLAASRRHLGDGRDTTCKSCTKMRTSHRAAVTHRDETKEYMLAYHVERRARVRAAVLEAYGGSVCACCGETEPKFLTIDHVNNDGAAFRRKIAGKRTAAGYHTYIWLIRNNYPPGFQVLCMNCNHGKRMNGGVCPHRGRRNDQAKAVGPSGPKCSASSENIQSDEEMVSPAAKVAVAGNTAG